MVRAEFLLYETSIVWPSSQAIERVDCVQYSSPVAPLVMESGDAPILLRFAWIRANAGDDEDLVSLTHCLQALARYDGTVKSRYRQLSPLSRMSWSGDRRVLGNESWVNRVTS